MKVFTEANFYALTTRLRKEGAGPFIRELEARKKTQRMVLDVIIPKLNQLENNTWDKYLVNEIKQILLMNLGE